MTDKPDSIGAPSRHWTRIEVYLVPLRWRGSAHRRRNKRRLGYEAEPERLMLGMVPFLVLIVGLAIIAVAIFAAALPGGMREEPAAQPESRRAGTAPPGWIDG